ncbi:MAG: hypothetical protein KME32_33480 [Mojavia pulchra JT2-VF2]|jgi:hypothetical protein|uniref:Uncharacterized protein n=1 Tax=Mojavia pulchra JT2-VF2 TaxID=287848 RepID=A0A951UK32_9NOST|nr:hypothetical protein [Mojavia pulchra JT2-VF2]
MEPTVSIPPGWQYPRFGFGQRTERGQIIGLKYYAEDTYLAEEYGAGWRYILLPNKNTEDDETRIENDIKLLSVQELKTFLEAQISNHLRQVALLKHELKAAGLSIEINHSTAQTQPVSQKQEQFSVSLPNLHTFVDAAKFILNEIARHPDYLTLNYQPDLTIGDAETALSYLELELEPNQSPALDIADQK